MTFYTNITSFSHSEIKKPVLCWDYITSNEEEGVTLSFTCFTKRLPSLMNKVKTTILINGDGNYRVWSIDLSEEIISIVFRSRDSNQVYTDIYLAVHRDEEISQWVASLYKIGVVQVDVE